MDVEQSPQYIKPVQSVDQSVQDAHDLAAMGHDQALTRKFGLWSMLSLAFCVLGTYSTFAQDLSSGLTNGGAITILWGLVLVTLCNLCVAVSLGELASSMPTALGQAYWVHRLWNTPLGRFASYMTAWINTFGWWTLTASQVAFMTEFLLGMKVMFNTDWTGAGTGWLEFVVYIGVVFVLTVINVVGCRKEQVLPWVSNFVGVWFTGLFVALSLALLISVGIKPSLSFQPASFVFGKWINQTGWGDGVIWFVGLVQAAYGLTAFDAVIHMVEEIPAPRRNAPRVIWLAVLLGAITGFLFMIVCLFCIQSIDDVINGPTGLPFIELMLQTVGLKGSAILIALFIFNGLGQGIGILTTASRLTWGFARDGGLPWSRYLSHVDPIWKAPVRSLWGQGFLIALVGILYLFANTVLEAILSVSTIALTISYGVPIAVLLWVGRDKLPPGEFRLGRWGTFVNWVSIIYCIITTVFFLFPGSPNPSPSDMNYAIAVFGVMLVVSITFWFIQGSRTYLQTDDALAQMILAQRLENERSVEDRTAGSKKK
ncbi:amino acid/polyamine transporter I [Aspergillus ambiguus]|uniref:putative amino acid permease family protein n=1 Tax=Aspergillus ambiguus TaxID=176160 RepID=UPI003CCCF7A2